MSFVSKLMVLTGTSCVVVAAIGSSFAMGEPSSTGVTVTKTVAVLVAPVESVSVYANWSTPLKSASGAYRTVLAGSTIDVAPLAAAPT